MTRVVKRKYILIFLMGYFSLGFTTSMIADVNNLRFDVINQEKNLSHNSTVGIAQDNKGFIWITTIDGLNRYDGYSCKVYRHNFKDSTSISGNRVGSIYFDSHGYLWVGTFGKGLNRFNLKTETFKHFFHNSLNPQSISSNFVGEMTEDKNGNIWIGTKNGLNVYSYETKDFTHYFPETGKPFSIGGQEIYSELCDSDGVIWVATVDGGLSKFDPDTKKFTNYKHNHLNHQTISTNNLTTMDTDKFGRLWIGTYGHGLEMFDPKSGEFSHFINITKNKNSLSNNIVYSVYADDHNNIWAGTREGLSIYNYEEKIFYNYLCNPRIKQCLSSNNISRFFKDKDGVLWIATYGGGVDRVQVPKEKLLLYTKTPDKNSISNNFITSATSDGNRLLIGTVYGLNILDRSTGIWEQLFHITNDKSTISSNSIGALANIGDQYWIGTRGRGIDVLDKSLRKIRRINSRNSILPSDDIIRFYPHGNSIWILTSDAGIFEYKINTSKIVPFISEDSSRIYRNISHPRSILIENDNIWISCYKSGIYVFDINKKLIDHYSLSGDVNSFGNNTVWDIHKDSKGKIWFATDAYGICYINRDKNKVSCMTMSEGLPSNVVYSILEDRKGQLWLSTNNGLSRLNPHSDKFYNYGVFDGLQAAEFNYGASCITEKGELVFGGVNGFNIIDPVKLSQEKAAPNIVFTDILINNQEMVPDTSIAYIHHLEFSYEEKVITIDFSALNFTASQKTEYLYILEGFDDHWIHSNKKHSVTYTNLDPGDYIFKVKSYGRESQSAPVVSQLSITIIPPFWARTSFRLFVVFTTLVLFIAIIKYFSTKKLKKQINALDKQRVVQAERERISRDLHDNIGSHLTFIISSLDNLSYGENQATLYKRLEQLSAFGRHTLDELRTTIWAMKHETTDLNQVLLRVKRLKEQLSENLDDLDIEVVSFGADAVQINLSKSLNIFRIIEEAIQNTIKHARATRITIKFSRIQDGFRMDIYDNGNGFKLDKVERGNGLQNMKYRCEESGGRFTLVSNESGTHILCDFFSE